MNRCSMQQRNVFAACEEIRAPFARADQNPPVFCPKPRRLSPLSTVADPVRPVHRHSSYQADFSDSSAAAELLDTFLVKGGEENEIASSPPFFCGSRHGIASSPPFFCGSPPRRAANPVVHDVRFGEDRPPAHFTQLPLILPGPPMSPKQGCAHAKYGLMPAAVRIEGFDCLSRSRSRRRGCSSITAVA